MTGILRQTGVTLTAFVLAGCLLPAVASASEDQWRRDPFQYKGEAAEARKVQPAENDEEVVADSPEISLKGIIRNSAGAYVAIINGQQYTAGDTIGKARIVKIMPYEVVVSEDGRIRRVNLFGKHVKWGSYEN